MSKRDDIVAALLSKLAEITVDNGYSTGCGENVYGWRRHPPAADELPCLLVNDTRLARELLPGAMAINRLQVQILAMVAGSAAPETARDVEADVVKCLAGWWNAGGNADALWVTGSELIMEQHENKTGAVLIDVSIEYQSPIGQV